MMRSIVMMIMVMVMVVVRLLQMQVLSMGWGIPTRFQTRACV